MDIPAKLKKEMVDDPESLEVIAMSMRNARGEQLSEEEIKEWREKSLKLIDKNSEIKKFLEYDER